MHFATSKNHSFFFPQMFLKSYQLMAEEDAKYTNFGQKGKMFLDFNIKTLEDIRKAIAKKPYEKLP